MTRVALIHPQFETIHPLPDGTGRIGHSLIAAPLEHWGLPAEPLMVLSAYLKQHHRRGQPHQRRPQALAEFRQGRADWLPPV
jgi:Fic family protein